MLQTITEASYVWLWAGRVARECRQDGIMGVTLKQPDHSTQTKRGESDNIKIVFDKDIVNIWPTVTWARYVSCHWIRYSHQERYDRLDM